MSTIVLPPIADLIAHRDSMLLLDCLLAADAETCCAEYTPRPDAWYADAAGNMPAWIGIELMAQTVAAHVGFSKRANGEPPKQGALLGTRSYKTCCPAFAAGAALHIHARVNYRDVSGLAAFDCRITDAAGTELANATLKVYEPEDFQVFLKGNLE